MGSYFFVVDVPNYVKSRDSPDAAPFSITPQQDWSSILLTGQMPNMDYNQQVNSDSEHEDVTFRSQHGDHKKRSVFDDAFPQVSCNLRRGEPVQTLKIELNCCRLSPTLVSPLWFCRPAPRTSLLPRQPPRCHSLAVTEHPSRLSTLRVTYRIWQLRSED